MTASEQERVTTAVQSLEKLGGTPHAQVFDGEPKTIRLTLEAGEEIAPHQHPDRVIVLSVLDGRLAVTLGDDVHEIGQGELARFDGAQDIAPKALADTTAVLVLAMRSD